MSLKDSGILEFLKSDSGIDFIDTFEPGITREESMERRRRALLVDLFLTGSNAVTEDGCLVNLDMVGRLERNGLTLIGSTTAAFWPDLVSVANTERLPSNFDDKYMGGSDQWCYYQAGRPVLFFFTGLHSEYHTPADDTWLIDAEGMADIGELATRVLIEVATRPSLQ